MSAETVSPARAASALTSRMRRLARKELELDRLQAELNSRVEALKGLYERRVTPLQGAVSRLREGIEQFCRAERHVLMPDSRKSVSTPYGRIGFRRAGPQVVLARDRDEEQACCALHERELDGFIRLRQSLDRAAVKRALETGEADAALLAACGIRLSDGAETFYCMVDRALDGGGGRQ